MLNKTYKEVVLIVENEEIPCVTSILCESNDRLNEIINDDKIEDKVSLPEQITRKAFTMLCSYYGYGMIDVDENNISELLLCCICLNEVDLINICAEYILSHLNTRFVIDILNLLYDVPENYLNDVKTAVCNYIRLNCIIVFDDHEIFKLLHLDNIQFIISLDNILIPSEKYLLEKILSHYHQNLERFEKKEDKNRKYNDVMKYLNWKDINYHEIDENDLDIIDLNVMKKSKMRKPIKRKYGRIPKTENEKLNEIILNGMNDIDSIKDLFYEDCEYLLSFDNIFNEISDYLKKSEYLLEIVTILRIIKRLNIKKNININNTYKMDKIRFLIKKYEDSKENNIEEKAIIVECLSYFLDDGIYLYYTYIFTKIESIIDMIYRWIGNEIIIEVLNCEKDIDKSEVIEYVKTSLNEDDRESISLKIKNEEIRMEFNKITHDLFNKSERDYKITSSNEIKVGIELNYYESSCSIIEFNGIGEVMLDYDQYSIPNYVCYYSSSNEIYVGKLADCKDNRGDVIKYPLEIIGLDYTDKVVQNIVKESPTKIINVNGIPKYEVKYDNQIIRLSAKDVLTEILRYIKRKLNYNLNINNNEKVGVSMAVPVYLNYRQRKEVIECAKKADIIVENMIPIPVAICTSFYSNNNIKSDEIEKVLICELSDLDFNISIVQMNNKINTMNILSSEGITNIGSKMFVDKLVNYFLEKYKESTGKYEIDQKKLLRLRRSCEQAISLLCMYYIDTCTIDCSFLEDNDIDTEITLSKLEYLCRDLLKGIYDNINSLIEECKLSLKDINRILLKNDKVKLMKKCLNDKFGIEVEEIMKISSINIQ